MDIYLVGGAVRDQLLGIDVKDRDWVVVHSTPEDMIALGYQQVGADFPVFLHPQTHEEYALARTERKHGKGYTGFVCEFSDDVTLEEDLLRRDLTINAMAFDKQQRLIDPFNGKQDLDNRQLRHVSPAFIEDPVRVLRVARFAARFHHLGFTVADETMSLMRTMVAEGELTHLVAERVFQETHRALAEPHPEVFFRTLAQCGALLQWYPEWTLFEPDYTCAFLSDHVNQRWGAYAQYFSDADMKAVKTRLKLPNDLYDILATSSTIYHYFRERILSPSVEDCLELFNKSDAWRKQERTLSALEIIIECLAAEKTIKQDALKNWTLYLSTCVAINARDIVASGISGPEVGIKLTEKRKHALEKVLKSSLR